MFVLRGWCLWLCMIGGLFDFLIGFLCLVWMVRFMSWMSWCGMRDGWLECVEF